MYLPSSAQSVFYILNLECPFYTPPSHCTIRQTGWIGTKRQIHDGDVSEIIPNSEQCESKVVTNIFPFYFVGIIQGI